MNGQGCVPDAAKALWTSPDGRNWSRVDLAGQFGGKAVGSVSAGPKGYMAISVSSDSAVAEPLVWLSANGRTWRSSPFPAAAFLNAYLASSLVLSNGYLVAGRIGSVAGYGSGSYPLTTPQLWWSADGISWTQLPMPGLKAAPEAEAAVTRISDGRFIAHVVNWDGPVPPDGPTQLWASSDGVTWSAAGPGFPAPAVILSDGHQALEPTTTDAGVTVATSTDGLAWTQRVVDGAGPGDWTAAVVGPSGLLVSSGNSQVWLAALA
jgi:hypothetical protein